MNTNLLKILLLITCIIFVASGFAQKTFYQSDIVGKWRLKDSTSPSFSEYTDTGKSVSYNLSTILEMEYYLSDIVETTFDKSKVNKNTEGKFLIENDKICNGNRCMSIYEILSVTDDKLILKIVSEDYILIYTTNKDSILHIGLDKYGYGKDTLNYKPAFDYEHFTQQTFQKSDIANKKWFLVYPNYKFEYDYYFTDNITTFDPSKVGKSTSGRYIIERSVNGVGVNIYKILKLTDSELILKDLWSPERNKRLVYKAVEE